MAFTSDSPSVTDTVGNLTRMIWNPAGSGEFHFKCVIDPQKNVDRVSI